MLPFIQFTYSLGENLLDFTENETDLGVVVTSTLNWNEQCQKVYSKANQMLGLAKRTCFFVRDVNRRRVLYLTLVRSQLEHCSIIWRPTTKTKMTKFEGLQKRALKWILSEEELSYSSFTTYIRKCRQADVLPIYARFDLIDLLFFYKVVNKLIPVALPDYLVLHNGVSRLRSTHLDRLCFESSVHPNNMNNAFSKGFFYRAHLKWNRLPLDIRESQDLLLFRTKLRNYLWKSVMEDATNEDDEFGNIWTTEID